MSDTEQKTSKGMIRFVLTVFVIAIMVAVAYLVFFTPGKAEPVSPVIRGVPMRYYVFAIHTDETRNRLHDVLNNLPEAAAIERELQSLTRPGDNYFIRMFPAQNVDDARIKADEMRPIPLMFH